MEGLLLTGLSSQVKFGVTEVIPSMAAIEDGMATTSLKLSDELKEQAAEAAAALGVSPHAFMVEAIRQATHNAELRRAFLAQGNAARKQAIKTGKAYAANDVHQHVRDRINGVKKSSLKLKSW
jgi:predicted transcriptional regulator